MEDSQNQQDTKEAGHNYPFDSTLSPYSNFEEKIFPKLIIGVAIITFVIVLLSIIFFISQLLGLILFVPLALLWFAIFGSIVKYVWKRREKIFYGKG
ncbi:MAG: hypothetical protein QMC80_04620 [Thermoplasmatales archaeon]|nr:hypothetical protein [Thermoplasmatales archaeon]